MSQDPLASRLLKQKQSHLVPCVYHFYRDPMVLARGEGMTLFDTQGRAYLDFYSGVGVVNCGHCHPEIVAAAQRQLATLQHTTSIYLTQPVLELAQRLTTFAGGGLTRAFFCTSGSEAVEGALMLARIATGRPAFLALSRGLHGRTHLSLGVTGSPFWRCDPFSPDCVQFVESPVCSHCPWEQTRPDCDLACANAVEEAITAHPQRFAAVIAEPIHGNGGIVPMPPGYLPRVREITRKHGVLLILDEAQTGFCRTGDRFAFQHEGVEPDALTVCKALGNGLPVAAYLAREEVAATWTRPSASTFGGNPVSATAALATLEVMTREQLEARAARLGTSLGRRLTGLAAHCPAVEEVRGRGLMVGMVLRRHDGWPAAAELDRLLERLKELGILAGKTGPDRNVLTFMPPLIVEEAHLDRLEEALARLLPEIFPDR